MICVLLSLVLYMVVSADGHLYPRPLKLNQKISRDVGDPGTPLFLTPYIENGRIEEARNLSRVHFPGFPDLTSYSGLFTVNKKYNSNQFFWYFPAESISAQVIVWLQGGPGGSSLYGLFEENGPLEVKNETFQERAIYWSQDYHVIYIDNPVGTGFSFTNDTSGLCSDQKQVTEELYSTLVQFFQLFPHLQRHKLFLSGESYAGKYVPALGYAIHKKNPSAYIKLNLAGMIIGNGLCDPIHQLGYGDYLYQIGLIDTNQKHIIKKYEKETKKNIKLEDWDEAYNVWEKLLNTSRFFIGDVSIYNLMNPDTGIVCTYCQQLESSSIRSAIHVGDLSYSILSSEVYNSLKEDITKSVAPLISELLDHYPMQFYNGQLDICVAYPLTENFLQKLNFSARKEYLKAKRQIDVIKDVNGDFTIQTGFTKRAGNLRETLIRNAGHTVPSDQPLWAKEMLHRFIYP